MKKINYMILILYLFFVVFVLYLLVLIAINISKDMNNNARQDISNTLTSVRDTAYSAIKSSLNNHRTGLAWANNPEFRDSTVSLLKLSPKPFHLTKSSSQKILRDSFTELRLNSGYHQYFIISPENINLASNMVDRIGQKNLIAEQGYFEKSRESGEAVFNLPIRTQDEIVESNMPYVTVNTRTFISSPIRDQSNGIMATLILVLDPDVGFVNILRQARIGVSGESYVFNRQGLILSENRFDRQLNLSGPIQEENISLISHNINQANENSNDSETNKINTLSPVLPLTFIVNAAVDNRPGIDLHGHTDYHGESVVAAWLWDEEQDIGLVTTLDTTEAYHTYSRTSLIFMVLSLSIFFLLLSAVAIYFFIRLRRESERLTNIEKNRAATYFDAAESIIVALDIDGNITNVNRKGCEILRSNSKELIGKNWITNCVPKEQQAYVGNIFTRLIRQAEKASEYCETNIISKSGEIIPVAWRNTLLFDVKKQISGTLSNGIDLTDRSLAEENLRESEARFRMLVEGIGQKFLIYRQTVDGTYQYLSGACQKFTGISNTAALGLKTLELFKFSSETFEKMKNARHSIIKNNHHESYEGDYLHPNKTTQFIEITESCEKDQNGHVVAILGIIKNVTKNKKVEQQLRQAATVFDNTDEGILIANADAKIILVNKSFTDITGYSSEETIGKNILFQCSKEHNSDYLDTLGKKLKTLNQWRGQIWNRRKNGDIYPAWQNISVVKDKNGLVTNQIAIFSDITLLKQSEERLLHMVHHDSLTGLPNRLRFIANLEQSLQSAIRHKHRVGLMFVDLDRFKSINDTQGHGVGDEVLKVIAQRMKNCLRAEDTVARFGGDEFTILLSEIAIPEDAGMMAEKLVEAIRKPIAISKLSFVVSASIGISIYPEDGTESDVLLKAADSAMYQAKALGKDNFHFFTKEIAARSMKYVTLERDMKYALKRQQFELYYQPQMRLKDNKIVGLEALIRWNHPSRGLITPNEFIHIADDSDMIDSITEWVISTALSDHEEWADHGCDGLRVAVNITGRQFIRERSIKKVVDVLDTFEPESHYLKLDLEITETAFKHVSQVVKVINMLKKRNIVFSIDDFGTGHSSLSRLKEIPVETLKIDQSFIRDMTSDNNDKEIVRAIISMGHSLGMRVIGEGVENISQLEILQELGCDEIQGFYISLPLPADQVTKLLDQQRKGFQELN